MEEFKKKDEKICRLENYNKKLFDQVKKLKEEKKHGQNHEKTMILDEDTTKILEKGIYKNVENDIKE